MLVVALLSWLAMRCESSISIRKFAAIQNQEETYFSYLPYSNACNFTQPNIMPGSLSL